MEFAIKIGDKYLVDIDSFAKFGGVTGHTVFIGSPNGLTLKLEDEPEYFSHMTIKTWSSEVVELMRWKDIKPTEIRIIPKR